MLCLRRVSSLAVDLSGNYFLLGRRFLSQMQSWLSFLQDKAVKLSYLGVVNSRKYLINLFQDQ